MTYALKVEAAKLSNKHSSFFLTRVGKIRNRLFLKKLTANDKRAKVKEDGN